MKRAVAASAVALAAIAALGAQLWVESGVPSDADWESVARAIAADARSDDLVLLHPAWADRGRLFLRGVRVEAWPAVVPDDLVRAGRVWQVSQFRAPWAGPAPLAIHGARHGMLELALFVKPPSPPLLFDFTAAIPTATVTSGGTPCQKETSGRHRCSQGAWNHVGADDFEIDYVARRCVWAHPIGPRSAPVRIDFHGATLGAWIRFRAGFVGASALDLNGKPVDVDILVDGAPGGSLSVPVRPGYHSFAVSTARALPGAHEVAFLVSSADFHDRQLCFDAWAE